MRPAAPRSRPPAACCPRRLPALLLAVAALAAAACGRSGDESANGAVAALPASMLGSRSNADARPPAVPFDTTRPQAVARAAASYPHDSTAYTQGLEWHDGALLESLGGEGRSELRRVALESGAVEARTALPPRDFGEGIATVGDRVYQLTWKGGRGYVYDARTLALVDSVRYEGEGWGLATDGTRLFLSDGSSRIRVLDPATFAVQGVLQVQDGGSPVWMLNELEWVDGELWANVYQTEWIARIDPASGAIVGWVDVSELLSDAERRGVAARDGVANGIAWDRAEGRVLLTGKMWPRLFAVPLASLRPERG